MHIRFGIWPRSGPVGGRCCAAEQFDLIPCKNGETEATEKRMPSAGRCGRTGLVLRFDRPYTKKDRAVYQFFVMLGVDLTEAFRGFGFQDAIES